MKKLLCLTLALMMLCSSTLASASQGLPSVYDFEPLFENAAALTGSGHQITTQNLTSSQGKYRTNYIVSFSDSLSMNISVLDATQETDEIVLLATGGNVNESISFLYAIGELLYSTGAISDMKDLGSVLNLLGFFENLQDGDSNSIVINKIEYGYVMSSVLGCIMFYARIPE